MILDTDEIEFLGLGVRATNNLKSMGVTTIGKLCRTKEDSIRKYRNVGKKTLQEINDALFEHGWWLGMDDKQLIDHGIVPDPLSALKEACKEINSQMVKMDICITNINRMIVSLDEKMEEIYNVYKKFQ